MTPSNRLAGIDPLELPIGEPPAESTTGTVDAQDARDDASADENEIPIGEVDETTEAPEEFEIDDEDELGHPEDDDADDIDDDLDDGEDEDDA